MKGKFIVISAPSGAGKTTIVKRVLEKVNSLEFSVSATSRGKRDNEVNGSDYYFISVQEFKERIVREEFLEWEEVYENQYYGTLLTEVQRIWDKGNHVIFDVDVKGGLNIKRKFPDITMAIFISPPSLEELRKRLENRNTEDQTSLDKRVAQAEAEMTFASEFDIVVVNKILEPAVIEVIDTILPFLQE